MAPFCVKKIFPCQIAATLDWRNLGIVARKSDLLHANYKGADQSVIHRLISTFVILFLESIIVKLAIHICLVYAANQAGASIT